MSNDKKPKGYINRFLCVDFETSGINFGGDSAAIDYKTGQYFQAVSAGLIVVDAESLEEIEELYLEIKWDGVSQWSDQAEKVHGKSKAYLEENGVDMSEAVEAIANLIIDHWGPDGVVCIAAHNPSFDLAFLKNTLRSEGLEIKFGSKVIDSNTLGLVCYRTHNSDDLFEMVGVPARGKHNSLDDARAVLQVIRVTRAMADECFG